MREAVNSAIKAPLPIGDINGDGSVNILDISLWAKAFGTTSTSPRWNADADINHDGKVNILDGVIVAKSFKP
jgi:hypothetical protein